MKVFSYVTHPLSTSVKAKLCSCRRRRRARRTIRVHGRKGNPKQEKKKKKKKNPNDHREEKVQIVNTSKKSEMVWEIIQGRKTPPTKWQTKGHWQRQVVSLCAQGNEWCYLGEQEWAGSIARVRGWASRVGISGEILVTGFQLQILGNFPCGNWELVLYCIHRLMLTLKKKNHL